MPDLPATQHAIQFTGPGTFVHNRHKPVPVPGPTQILLRVEAVGICFSDTKLLKAFTGHPRKGVVLSGLAPEVLAEIPSYVPGDLPTVPGHEVVGRIVAAGADVKRHRVGERCLVQTDYRHLLTGGTNAAFGYNFEGGLQEYVLLDERMIIDPDTGERFLIPVDEEPSALRGRPPRAVGLRRGVVCHPRAGHPAPRRAAARGRRARPPGRRPRGARRGRDARRGHRRRGRRRGSVGGRCRHRTRRSASSSGSTGSRRSTATRSTTSSTSAPTPTGSRPSRRGSDLAA